MIVFDGIVSTLQHTGGISVLFNEIFSRLNDARIDYGIIAYGNDEKSCRGEVYLSPKRLLERYRACRIALPSKSSNTVFHSTYYRLPSDRRLKIVTTVHDFTYEKCVGGIPRAVHSLQKNHAIRNSDKIICVSDNTKNDLLEYLPDIPPEKIHVIHNGVSDRFHVDHMIAKENSILFVGQRGRYKNFKAVAQALSMLPALQLECVGGGGFTRQEIAFLEENIPGRFRHLGYVSTAELNSAYNRALCLVYPSLYEGFGIPVLEAMRAGCPVVAFNGSSIPEVAGDAAILLESATPDEIFSAIRRLELHSVQADLIEKGLCRSRKFSWNKTFKETLHVYNGLLHGSPTL